MRKGEHVSPEVGYNSQKIAWRGTALWGRRRRKRRVKWLATAKSYVIGLPRVSIRVLALDYAELRARQMSNLILQLCVNKTNIFSQVAA